MNHMPVKIPWLYLITDSTITKQGEFKDATDALEAGIRIIQYREKNKPEHEIIATAQKLRHITQKYNATLIINDHIDIAEKIHADGLHLGQKDTRIEEARKTFKGIIGVSASTLEKAIEAEKNGADYIGLGPIFPTATKNDASPPIGIEGLKKIKSQVTIPIVAIGGINKDNAKQVLDAGADSIAVISAIIGKDIRKETHDMLKVIQ